jgi:RTX calcium-binding nonapeptide repeat (4 copies)
MDLNGVERIELNALGGTDNITVGDLIIGSHGADMLIGGDGNDFVDGGQGNDVAFLGAGNDVFQWDPGDGSDIVEGQDGTDALLFNGSNANENIDISANGSRVRLFRDVCNVTMDLNGIEHVQVAAAGGTDTITVDDLTGTDTKQVAIDLSSPLGSGQGDGQPDTVIVNGTAGDDRINVVSSGGSVLVNGLAAQVSISGAEAGKDNLVVNGLAGAPIQWRQRQREHRHLGQWLSRAAVPRRRQRHHGSQWCRAHQRRGSRRCGHPRVCPQSAATSASTMSRSAIASTALKFCTMCRSMWRPARRWASLGRRDRARAHSRSWFNASTSRRAAAF